MMSLMQWNDILQLRTLAVAEYAQALDRFERAHLTADCAEPYLAAGYGIHDTIDLGTARVPLDYALTWRERGASPSAAIVAWGMQLHVLAA